MIYILAIVVTTFFITMIKFTSLYSKMNKNVKQLERNNRLLKEKIDRVSPNESKNKSKEKKENFFPEPPPSIVWEEGREVKSINDIKREN